jgi:hypothetical protein
LPFGFIQPKVGQAIGRFLGELKEYDHRNSVQSTYMRLKVRINVNKPLQQSWKVRVNEGNYVQIIFKYEKLGIFCYLCGLLGHTDKNCPKLFDMDHDDGARGWGESIRPLITHMGTSATNKYIKDPIPSRPQNVSSSSTGIPSAAAPSATPHASTSISVNLDGRIVAVQKEISAIKSGILIPQKQAMVKASKLTHEASSSHNAVLPFATLPPADCDIVRHRSVVLGLLAEPHIQVPGHDSVVVEAADSDENRADLKKRKRAKAVKDKQDVRLCVVVLRCFGILLLIVVFLITLNIISLLKLLTQTVEIGV